MNFHGVFGAAAIASGLLFGPASVSAEPVPLQPHEVHQMYSGKTWVWDTGGGYFAPDGSFQAWTQDSEYGLMYAIGRWSVEIGGQLCYTARWYYANKSDPSRDCFAHWESNGSVLQRDEREGGDWYVHDLSSLRPGNLVAPKVPQLSAQIQ